MLNQPLSSPRKYPKWIYWILGISIGIIVMICSCLGILYYIGSNMTPEQKAAIYATSTARSIGSSPTQVTSSTATDEPTHTPIQISTAEPTVAQNEPSPSPFPPTDTATSIPATATAQPTETTPPTNTPITTQPTDPPLANIPVMDGLRMRTTRIYKSELGDDWPLSVDTGTLGCDGRNGVGAIVFALDDGTTYALNGVAKGRTSLSGRDIYLDIDPIWLSHPTVEGLKKNIGPLISRGLELCQ